MTARFNWLLVANLMLANFLVGIAGRIFAISLPTVARELQTDLLGVSWALISYQLSAVSLALVFGRIGDLYGRRTVFGLGLLLFTISSFLCGLSRGPLELILFRLLQGIGGAMTQSQGRALVLEAVPEESAGKAQGFMTTAFHGGFMLGPSIGGLIIDYFHWRGIFFFLVPVGAVVTILTLINREGFRQAGTARPNAVSQTIDYLGALLLVVTMFVLVALLDQRIMERLSPTGRGSLVLILLGALTAFLFRERTVSSPIIHLSLFRIRMFALSTVCLLLVTLTYSLTSFLLPFYLQEILHLSPSFMGFLFMTGPVLTVLCSPVSGYVADKVGPMLPTAVGAAFMAAGSVLGVFLGTDSHLLLPTLIVVAMGVSIALFNPPNHAAMIGAVPNEHRGVAAGSVYTVFGLGNIGGVTLGSFLMTMAFRSETGVPTAAPGPENPGAFVAALNFTFLVVVGISLLATVLSIVRGGHRSVNNPVAA